MPIKSDEAFVEQVFKLARNQLEVATRLTPANFWAKVGTRGVAARQRHVGCMCGTVQVLHIDSAGALCISRDLPR